MIQRSDIDRPILIRDKLRLIWNNERLSKFQSNKIFSRRRSERQAENQNLERAYKGLLNELS